MATSPRTPNHAMEAQTHARFCIFGKFMALSDACTDVDSHTLQVLPSEPLKLPEVQSVAGSSAPVQGISSPRARPQPSPGTVATSRTKLECPPIEHSEDRVPCPINQQRRRRRHPSTPGIFTLEIRACRS